MRYNSIGNKKIVVTLLCGALLLALYMMIFSFSDQDGAQSGSLSALVTEKCVELINALTGKHWSESVMKGMAEYFEHPVRKLAHFSEYAVMGMLVYCLWRQWMMRGRRLYLLSAVWVLVSAALDEFHQYFVPGRYSSVLDVLLDTSGGVFGIFVCVMCERWRAQRNHLKQ